MKTKSLWTLVEKNGIMELGTDTSMNQEQNGARCQNRMNVRCDK